jgi:hypothetical protein
VRRSREDSLWVITAQHREGNRATRSNRTRRTRS